MMTDIGRDGNLTAGDQTHEFINIQALLLSHRFHFRGNNTLFCRCHLSVVIFHNIFLSELNFGYKKSAFQNRKALKVRIKIQLRRLASLR
jgi:UDP-N-acetylenolpyruvoylglucosamine reductase